MPGATPLGELRPAVAGLCATLVGIGFARFAYTPLLPALVEAGWFSPPEAAYLGAANLIGYLVGAVGETRGRGERDHLALADVDLVEAEVIDRDRGEGVDAA